MNRTYTYVYTCFFCTFVQLWNRQYYNCTGDVHKNREKTWSYYWPLRVRNLWMNIRKCTFWCFVFVLRFVVEHNTGDWDSMLCPCSRILVGFSCWCSPFSRVHGLAKCEMYRVWFVLRTRWRRTLSAVYIVWVDDRRAYLPGVAVNRDH